MRTEKIYPEFELKEEHNTHTHTCWISTNVRIKDKVSGKWYKMLIGEGGRGGDKYLVDHDTMKRFMINVYCAAIGMAEVNTNIVSVHGEPIFTEDTDQRDEVQRVMENNFRALQGYR